MNERADFFIVQWACRRSHLSERIASCAWDQSSLGVQEPVAGPDRWLAWFTSHVEAESFATVAKKVAADAGIELDIAVSAGHSEDWMAGCREHFQPVDIGDGFTIAPPWAIEQDAPVEAGRSLIVIEPGMAFGTGTHATTQLCILLAEAYLDPQARVLDVGAGSGILLLAALKRSASLALGIEADPQAIANFRRNLTLNDFALTSSTSPSIGLIIGDGLSVLGQLPFDLVFVNMLSHRVEGVLKQASEPRLSRGRDRAVFVCSGILNSEWPALRADWTGKYGLCVIDEADRDEWIGFTARLTPRL